MSTIADRVSFEIKTALGRGGQAAEDVVSVFYDRVNWEGKVQLSAIRKHGEFRYEFVFMCDDAEFSYVWDVTRSRWQSIADASVCEHSGLPRSFFQGILAGLELVSQWEAVDSRLEAVQASVDKAWEQYGDLQAAIRLTKQDLLHAVGGHKPLMKACARQWLKQNKSWASFPYRQGKIEPSRSDDMPSVDLGNAKTWGEVVQMEPFSGIYIAFRGDVCEYVGKSVHIPNRIKSHSKVQRDHVVCLIPLPKREIHFAELYYIWLLRPTLNSEGVKTAAGCN